jgi:hypothetical protein
VTRMRPRYSKRLSPQLPSLMTRGGRRLLLK